MNYLSLLFALSILFISETVFAGKWRTSPNPQVHNLVGEEFHGKTKAGDPCILKIEEEEVAGFYEFMPEKFYQYRFFLRTTSGETTRGCYVYNSGDARTYPESLSASKSKIVSKSPDTYFLFFNWGGQKITIRRNSKTGQPISSTCVDHETKVDLTCRFDQS